MGGGGGSGYGAGLGFGLGEGTESDLGSVEKLVAILFLDGADEHAVAGAGDEIADVFIAAEGRHGLAEGFAGVAFGGVFVLGSVHRRSVDLVPRGSTAGHGMVSKGGAVGVFQKEECG